MMFAEVIYEPGSKSVVSFDDLNELKAALKEQHDRAKAGDVGGPTGHPAERITKVLIYNNHPGDLGEDFKVDSNNVNALVSGMTKDGKLDMNQLVSALRDEASPIVVDPGRHESMYKQNEEQELDMSFLDGNGGDE